MHNVDFVTGAAVAIRRSTWDVVGRFDEGFIQLITKMPTITIAHAAKELKLHVQPQQLSNIFSAAMNEKKPTKHTSSGYISRYQFICKHFDDKEISEFIESEIESLNTIGYLDHVIGRIIAARYTFTQPACDSRTPPIGLG